MRFSLTSMVVLVAVVSILLATWQNGLVALFIGMPILGLILAVWAASKLEDDNAD